MRVGDVADTVASPAWRPFRVVATIADPVITVADPMHLDGPLAYCAYLAARESGVVLPPLTVDRCADFRVPLATWTRPAPAGTNPALLAADGTVWGWCCSRAVLTEHGTTAVEIRKKPPTQEYARYTTDARHHDGLGAHKARNITYPGRLVTHVTWWALGDQDATASLLTRLRALGRVTGHGNGRVLKVEVQEGGPADRDAWMNRDFPAPVGRGVPGAVRAPYWHGTRKMPVTPGMAV